MVGLGKWHAIGSIHVFFYLMANSKVAPKTLEKVANVISLECAARVFVKFKIIIFVTAEFPIGVCISGGKDSVVIVVLKKYLTNSKL